ncbi:MAG: DUF438 domain-containing protein [Tissierellia bacterium]|nr:DUF438 domain-containing protein [Tissierellia bacterium]
MGDKKKVERLKEYVQGVLDNKDGKMLYQEYKEDIERVTPRECFEIFTSRIEEGYTPREILKILDKVINVFHKSLASYKWKKPRENSFLDILMKENAALEERLGKIRKIILEKKVEEKREEIRSILKSLEDFNEHYLKKENILFPYMEKKMDIFNGLSIMWSLHDEARESLKNNIALLEKEEFSLKEFNVEIGKLFFAMLGIVKKENLILFPAAMELMDESEWEDMNRQSTEYGFPFIERPPIEEGEKIEIHGFEGMKFKTETGELSFEQIMLLFNALPVDLTFVDENNKVRFFTKPKDRTFPRSPAVIGRDVRNCHPAESVHVVDKIIDAFREGSRDTANFWIDFKGRKLLIQYFALRNSKGEYKGVLEVTQDITDIKKLEGERRLLQWE